jgi:hypothetical protein
LFAGGSALAISLRHEEWLGMHIFDTTNQGCSTGYPLKMHAMPSSNLGGRRKTSTASGACFAGEIECLPRATGPGPS